MNITIKITHPSGTVMEVNIPMLDSAAISMPSAPVTPDEPQAASETGNPVAGGLVDTFCNEVTKEDLKPSGIRYGSVADLISACDSLACETTGEKRVGEDGEGDGRIGGMGERKEEGGEGEGGEENRVLVFKCQDGDYTLPPALHADFCSAFGAPAADRELIKARLWCETNPQNRKTRRGMGRFLNAWLCRAQGEKRQSIKSRSGSLLDSSNSSQQGW